MRKTIFAVAALLVIGIGTVAMASGGEESEQEETNDDRAGIVEQVLTDLVTDGTITQDQSDAILEALEEKKEEIVEQREEAKELLKSFWEDEVLTQEEIEQLPFADGLLRLEGVSEALEDGQLTKEEIKELRSKKRGHGRLRAAGQHLRGGHS
jgi:hypothetical protein